MTTPPASNLSYYARFKAYVPNKYLRSAVLGLVGLAAVAETSVYYTWWNRTKIADAKKKQILEEAARKNKAVEGELWS